MNDNNPFMRPEEVLVLLFRGFATARRDRIEVELVLTPDLRWNMDLGEWKTRHLLPFVLSAMTAGAATTMIPDLPADHLAEARKLVISPQQLLIILITLIVLVGPAVVFSSDPRQMIAAYDAIAAGYAAGYTFSDRGKRNGR